MRKRVLVTGAAKRLGAEIARMLAKQGYDVVIHYRNSKKEAEQIAEECRSFGVDAQLIQGDFSTRAGVEAFISQYRARFPDTYGLVNNVGDYVVGECDDPEMLFWTNVFAPQQLMVEMVDLLQRERGAVVNLGFVGVGGVRGSSYCPVYLSSKEALLSLTRSYAKAWAPKNVRVNMVSPGYLDNAVDLPENEKLPMGRPALCEEVARVVAFLLDPASAYITGQNLDVAGGIKL